MNQRLTVASHNPGKRREIEELLRGLPIEVRSLDDVPDFLLPEETGATFAENAALKAIAAARATGGWALADDSGLEVTALGGEPGVRSARVATSDPERIHWLLERLAEVPAEDRGAEFVCALALADATGHLLGAWEGRVAGRILGAPRGSNGFGYDPVFLHESSGRTFAEMTPAEKSAVSHRGQALRAFRDWMAHQPLDASGPTSPPRRAEEGTPSAVVRDRGERGEGTSRLSPPVSRLLLVRRSGLGDVIVSMPALVALRRAYPDAYIAWLVETRFADLVRGHECLDEVIAINRHSLRNPSGWLAETRRVGRLVRDREFDIAVDLQGRQKSALMCYLSGAPRRVGFQNEFLGFPGIPMINEVVPFDPSTPAVERSLAMASYLGAEPEPVEFRYPLLPEAVGWAEGFLEAWGLGQTPLFAFILGASRPNKCWPVGHFAELAGMIRGEGLGEVVLLGGKGERERAHDLQELLGEAAPSAVGMTNLPQLAALLARCRLAVAGDTGALHLAVALGKPVVGLYGPTSPRLTGPWGPRATVLWDNLFCGPCVRHPTCDDYHCMSGLTPSRVMSAVRELLRPGR